VAARIRAPVPRVDSQDAVRESGRTAGFSAFGVRSRIYPSLFHSSQEVSRMFTVVSVVGAGDLTPGPLRPRRFTEEPQTALFSIISNQRTCPHPLESSASLWRLRAFDSYNFDETGWSPEAKHFRQPLIHPREPTEPPRPAETAVSWPPRGESTTSEPSSLTSHSENQRCRIVLWDRSMRVPKLGRLAPRWTTNRLAELCRHLMSTRAGFSWHQPDTARTSRRTTPEHYPKRR
jgi:hypothetical protein